MTIGLVGRKVGMTRIFTDEGDAQPVTVLDVSDNRITQIKTADKNGYSAVQVAYGKRRASRVRKPLAGHLAKAGVEAGHTLKEFRADAKALEGLKVRFVRNPDFAGGIASSVKAGIAAVPDSADGALVCLGDMPLIDAKLIDRLIDAFAPDRGNLIAVPASEGRRGNPVLWSRRFFRELMTLEGDVGARHLIDKHGEAVAEVPVEGQSAFLDIDTPQALEAARRS